MLNDHNYYEYEFECMEYSGYTEYMDEMDEAIAAKYPCKRCSGKSVYGKGFKKGASYRGFAVCPDCGHIAEF